MSESALDRAREGDAQAFEELMAPHVRELRLHCYRMLGSVADAQDVTQETLLAAWRAVQGFAGGASLRTWLYRIATNRCLNVIRDAKRRTLPEPSPPFDPPEASSFNDVTWLQPYPNDWLDEAPGPDAAAQARETLELAFITALQRLPPRQSAALLLCDVLEFSLAEAAGMLHTTSTAIKGLLQRARVSMSHRGRAGCAEDPPCVGSAEEQDLARRFANALVTDDIDTLLALLTDEAWLAMPPARHEYRGRTAIAGFLRASALWHGRRGIRLLPIRAWDANASHKASAVTSSPATKGLSPAVRSLCDYSGSIC